MGGNSGRRYGPWQDPAGAELSAGPLKEGGAAPAQPSSSARRRWKNWGGRVQKVHPTAHLCGDGRRRPPRQAARRWAEADLSVTSYDPLRRDEDRYAEQPSMPASWTKRRPSRTIPPRNTRPCQVRSQVRFALTGTPVENRLGELWSISSSCRAICRRTRTSVPGLKSPSCRWKMPGPRGG